MGKFGIKPKRWIGVDLDGVLAKYTKWKGASHIGEPVPEMVSRVKRWLAEGKTVKIFTARADSPEHVLNVKKWLKEQGLGNLEVTNKKDHGMIELWDDRAVRVIKNKGKPVNG